MTRRWLASFVAVCFFVGFNVGCGGDPLGRKALSGTVTLDGQPIKSGNVSFTPMQEGGIASGAVVTNGKFSITREQGLPIGKYRVEIHATDGTVASLPPGGFPGDDLPPPPKDLIPPSWNRDSEQTIEITDRGSTDFTFAVTTTAENG